ncbi:MAG: patatin-like phospholipase family protein [Planctomycetota bacterium]
MEGPEGTRSPDTGGTELALVMSGGGARAAYQVGFLAAVAERAPAFAPRILTGVSAGAINTAYLAATPGRIAALVDGLAELWLGLRPDDVMDASALKTGRLAFAWGMRLLSGGRFRPKRLQGLIDTAPLREFLFRALRSEDGSLPGIARKIEGGELDAVAVTASSYTSGGTVTFCQGRDVTNWERPYRKGRAAELRVEHIMASSSLPLFFPAIELEDGWYGDGGIRLTAPLAPAVHLGARRILAISTRADPKGGEVPVEKGPYPPPSQIGSALMNAIFLDQFDGDAIRMQSMNRLIEHTPQEQRGGLRHVDLEVFRPSVDLGGLANEYEAKLPRPLRFMLRGTGTAETRSNDFLSLIMFQHDYIRRLLAIGRADAEAQMPRIEAFLARS